MNYLKQFAILCTCLFLGIIVNHFFNTPIPMVVWGMIFLFVGLLLKIVKVSDVEETSKGLLKYFAFFFIPSGAAIMDEYGAMQGNVVEIAIIILVSTFLTMTVTALTVEYMIRRRNDDK